MKAASLGIAAAISLAFAGNRSADADVVTCQIWPGTWTVTSGGSQDGGSQVNYSGNFLIPVVDPAKYTVTGISGTITASVGTAYWNAGGRYSGLGTKVGLAETRSPNRSQYDTVYDYSASDGSQAPVPAYKSIATSFSDYAFTDATHAFWTPADFVKGSEVDFAGYRELGFGLSSGADADRAPSLGYVFEPYLIVTYTLQPVGSGDPSSLPQSSANLAPRFAEDFEPGDGGPVPSALIGQLPAGVVPHAGDTNRDGKVDIADLGALASHYGRSGTNLPGDVNYDGKVDVADLGILATNYGFGTSGGEIPLADELKTFGLPTVPEPSAAMFFVFASALGLRRRRAKAALFTTHCDPHFSNSRTTAS